MMHHDGAATLLDAGCLFLLLLLGRECMGGVNKGVNNILSWGTTLLE
jgi:hypothetical protein